MLMPKVQVGIRATLGAEVVVVEAGVIFDAGTVIADGAKIG